MTRVIGRLLACVPLIPEFCLVVAFFAAIWWASLVAAAVVAPAL
jgi:hypothetical protein